MVDEKVSLEDLNNAHDETQEPEESPLAENETEETQDETVEEETKEVEEEIQEEPEDHKERSKLGRKVADLESFLHSSITEIKNTITEANKPPEEPKEELDPGSLMTVAEAGNLWDEKEAQKQKRINDAKAVKEQYNSNYNAVLDQYGQDGDSEFHEKVMTELKANFNIIRTDNGAIDADLNYLKAANAVVGVPDNPLSKNKGKETPKLGGPSGTTVEVGKAKPIKLDKAAADLVARLKMSEESVAKALGKDSSQGLIK